MHSKTKSSRRRLSSKTKSSHRIYHRKPRSYGRPRKSKSRSLVGRPRLVGRPLHGSKKCVKKSSKKYKSRKSPAFSASSCKSMVMDGNDGNQYK